MANSQIGTYHLADNPQLYEIQRNTNFEFVVTDIDGILRAGSQGTESNAKLKNAQEILRMSVNKAFIPHFEQETVEVKRGNTKLKYAGIPTFSSGTIGFYDYIGAEPKEVMMAWQHLSYNVNTEKVSSLDRTNYKKTCYLIEYTPDYAKKVRTWKLYGCWVKSFNESEYSSGDGQAHTFDCVIEYDRAEIDRTSSI